MINCLPISARVPRLFSRTVIYEFRLLLFFILTPCLSVCVYLHIQHTKPTNQPINQINHHHSSSTNRLINPRYDTKNVKIKGSRRRRPTRKFCTRQILNVSPFFFRPINGVHFTHCRQCQFITFFFSLSNRCLVLMRCSLSLFVRSLLYTLFTLFFFILHALCRCNRRFFFA